MTRRPSRPGLTLTEALVSLFVMALGLLSLLTLFPLGAMQIGQALKDDRAAQTAMQADGFLRTYWQRFVVEDATEDNNLLRAFSDPANGAPGGGPTGVAALTAANDAQMSYPVLVDPLGWQSRTSPPLATEQWWIARRSTTGAGASVLPARRTLERLKLGGDPAALRACCLSDDVSFFDNGTPTGPTGSVDWGAKYNWAAILQRPRNDQRNVANLTVLVYDGRPPLLGAFNTELLVTVAGNVTPGATASIQITLPAADATLSYVRKGGWIMDGTITGTTRLANFYRIVGVNPQPGNTFQIDLETPIKANSNGGTAYAPQMYLLAGLTEVFERPQLRPTSDTPAVP